MKQFIILYTKKEHLYSLYQLIKGELIPCGICSYRTINVLFYRIYLDADGVPFNVRYKLI